MDLALVEEAINKYGSIFKIGSDKEFNEFLYKILVLDDKGEEERMSLIIESIRLLHEEFGIPFSVRIIPKELID